MLLTFLTACSKHKVTESLENPNITPGVKYTVTFNSMDGTTVSAISVEAGNLVKEPTAPTKEGYAFGGWYKEASLTNKWNFATDKVTEEMRLYASWEAVVEKYTVTYDSNGGTAVDSVVVEAGSFLTKPTPPTKSGHLFVAWETKTSNGPSVEWNFSMVPVSSNITLTAKWVQKVKAVETGYYYTMIIL